MTSPFYKKPIHRRPLCAASQHKLKLGLSLVWLALIWAAVVLGPTLSRAESIRLTVGQKFQLPAGANETVHLSGQHVIGANEKNGQIEVLAKSPGRAQVKVGARELQIEVIGPARADRQFQLQNLCRDRLGLKVALVQGVVTVTGELHRWADWQALAEAPSPSGEEYSFRARIDDDIKATILKELRERVSSRHLPPPEVTLTPEVRAVIPESLRTYATVWDEIFAPYGIRRVYDKSALTVAPLVRIQVVVAEVNKAASQKMGIEWPDSTSAQISPAFDGPSQVLLTLHALERDGLGHILASPNLLAKSGSEAEFLAGGELPIKVANHYVHEVVWKRHGIYLKIKPVAEYSGAMSIELTTEVSMPDKVYDELPSLKSNRMSTHFDLSEPRTIVLSGLVRQFSDESSEGLPKLSQWPLVGRLFGAKTLSSSQSELVIFVTPQIVNPSEESQNIKMPKGWRKSDDPA